MPDRAVAANGARVQVVFVWDQGMVVRTGAFARERAVRH
jgi:hypothetical protein